MSLVSEVEKTLKKSENQDRLRPSEALAAAERMADEFSDVTPELYVVPIERYIGASFKTK